MVLAVAAALLLGPRDPFNDRIDQFQVAGIGAERAVDFVPLGRDAVIGIAEVVFDVAFTLRRLRRRRLVKLAENDLVGLMDDVRQHIQPAAMGHAHHDLFRSERRPRFDQRIEQWDQRLRSFHREPFLPDELGMQKFFKRLSGYEEFQNAARFRGRQQTADSAPAPCGLAATFAALDS